jgi:PhzF family phenazine biosynthesis protein
VRIRVVDAFAEEPFTGNPAGVCLLEGDEWPAAAWMLSVAAEMNLSETAFAHRLTQDGAADWALRWFTPVTEVDLCGHATLATAHAMRESGEATAGSVRFATRSGVLLAHLRADGAITLDFPVNAPVPAPVPPGLAQALGAVPIAVYTTGELGDLLVELADEREVRELSPDQSALSKVEVRGVIVTARAATPGGHYHYVSRFFGPRVGIAEDPVTGSAHTALAPLWSARLGSDALTGLQASARTGLVHTRMLGERVELTGRAVTVLDGRLLAG